MDATARVHDVRGRGPCLSRKRKCLPPARLPRFSPSSPVRLSEIDFELNTSRVGKGLNGRQRVTWVTFSSPQQKQNGSRTEGSSPPGAVTAADPAHALSA